MRWFISIALIVLPCFVWAQEEASDEDKGMLTNFIESSLSGAGRSVEVNGLRGAISSEATIDEILISDDDGLWLTLKGVTLNWNRLAVLRGNINVNELSADLISLSRLPGTDPKATTAETSPFALPELPVSINIQKLQADRIELGAPILGEEIVMSLTTRLVLEGGIGETLLDATRLEGPAGKFRIDAAFSNETRQLRIDLDAHEDAGGIIVTLTKMPGAPELGLTVLGEGPLDDFTADLRMTSAGQERLAGQVELATNSSDDPEEGATRTIRADISGDMAPIFAPEYQEFFGQSIALKTLAHLYPDGRKSVDTLSLQSAALDLQGTLELSAGGLPTRFDLDLLLAAQDGDPILLPVSGGQTFVQNAELAAMFDADDGDRWTLAGTIDGLKTQDISLGGLDLDGSGIISERGVPRVSAALKLGMTGLQLEDAALSQAVGKDAQMTADLFWEQGQDLEISSYELSTEGMLARGSAYFSGLESDLAVGGRSQFLVADIARFSGLAKRDLGGQLTAQVAGHYATLTGAFNVDLTGTGRDLSVSDPRVDELASGEVVLAIAAERDGGGLTIHNVELRGNGVDVAAQGLLASEDSDLSFSADIAQVERLIESVSGPISITGRGHQTGADWLVDVEGSGPAGVEGQIHAELPDGREGSVKADLIVREVERFLPALPGEARVKAAAEQSGDLWQVALDASGPFQSSATGRGTLDPQGNQNDVQLSGSVPLAALNRMLQPNSIQGMANYDLSLQGAPSLEALSGNVTLAGVRFAVPSARVALEDINGTIGLDNSSAAIAVSSTYSGGGQISVNGSLSLLPPFQANLPVQISNLRHREGKLLETSLNGTVTLSGPLTGGGLISGGIDLGQTDIRISSSALGGGGAIPEIRHVGETSAGFATRSRAGLIVDEDASTSSSRPFNLDLAIRVAERISVRGLGLNADFDGGISLQGNTNNIITSGELDLIRGRMAFLSKNFELDEGRVKLEGDFVPTMRVQATSEQPNATIRLILDGRLDSPEIILESDPELPEDEVLSQLLFGRDLSSISPLQAAQLAGALATLSGQGPAVGGGLASSTGLDDLSLTFDEDGTPGVRAGAYINESLYSEVEVDSSGKSSISLNFDVNDKVKLKGKVDNENESGIGIFYQRDY